MISLCNQRKIEIETPSLATVQVWSFTGHAAVILALTKPSANNTPHPPAGKTLVDRRGTNDKTGHRRAPCKQWRRLDALRGKLLSSHRRRFFSPAAATIGQLRAALVGLAAVRGISEVKKKKIVRRRFARTGAVSRLARLLPGASHGDCSGR